MFRLRASLLGRSGWGGLAFACSLAVLAPMASAQQMGVANGVGSQFELAFWQSVAGSDDRSQLEAYLAQYPNGTFAALAHAKITAIEKRDAYARGTMAPTPVPAAPLAAPAMTAAAVLPAPVAAAAAPVATAVPATAAMTQPAMADQSLSEQLRALGQSQGLPPAVQAVMTPAAITTPAPIATTTTEGSATLASMPGAVSAALPARPQLAQLSDFALPDHFCSAVERNGFYDSVFTPAKDAAAQNNQTAIAHMQKLRQMYDALAQSQVKNAPTMNVIAGEAKEYEAVAADAYGKSAAYEGLFTRLMAVPVRKCS